MIEFSYYNFETLLSLIMIKFRIFKDIIHNLQELSNTYKTNYQNEYDSQEKKHYFDKSEWVRRIEITISISNFSITL